MSFQKMAFLKILRSLTYFDTFTNFHVAIADNWKALTIAKMAKYYWKLGQLKW